MICPNCSAVNDDNALICDNCGTIIVEEQDIETTLSSGFPFITSILIMFIVACSGWVFWRTNSLMVVSAADLLKFGGDFKSLTFSGEEWRLWSSTFLHCGLIHLAMNVACLWSFGPLLERIAGRVKFLSLYLISAIGSSIVSMNYNDYTVSIGASGAIFGIFASLIVYVVVMKNRFGFSGELVWAYFKNAMIFIGINLVYSMQPGIDMAGHVGGLAAGAVAGLLFSLIDCIKAKVFSNFVNCVLGISCGIVITIMTFSWINSVSWLDSNLGKYTPSFNWDLMFAVIEGDAKVHNNFGLMYANGDGVRKDVRKAVKWYRKAADQGLADAQFNLGVMYANGEGVAKDEAEAVKWYRKAAEQGDAEAQFYLARCYWVGTGVTKDEREAIKWYRESAKSEEAVKWYREAAEQGDAPAQYILGVMYDKGSGVQKDSVEATRWYRKAAEQGVAEAQYSLALHYKIAGDDDEAVKWYRKAADQGLADAQYWLGWHYRLRLNEREAVRWYRKAAEQGNENAKKALDRLGY